MEQVISNCDHRGPLLRMDVCDMCGSRGLPLEIYACDLHGECSLRPRHRKIRNCLGCDDIICVLDPQSTNKAMTKIRRPKPRPWTGGTKYIRDPKVCQHPSRLVVHTRIDSTKEPALLMLEIWCKHCGLKFTADGRNVFELQSQSIGSPALLK